LKGLIYPSDREKQGITWRALVDVNTPPPGLVRKPVFRLTRLMPLAMIGSARICGPLQYFARLDVRPTPSARRAPQPPRRSCRRLQDEGTVRRWFRASTQDPTWERLNRPAKHASTGLIARRPAGARVEAGPIATISRSARSLVEDTDSGMRHGAPVRARDRTCESRGNLGRKQRRGENGPAESIGRCAFS